MRSSVTEISDGIVDTNVFLHAVTSDGHSAECIKFLEALEAGSVRAVLDPVVVHELSYVLPRVRKGLTRAQIAEYLFAIVGWPGVVCDKALLIDAVRAWKQTPGLSFVDAYLGSRSRQEKRPVYTMNRKDFTDAFAVTSPLPH